MYSVDFPFTVFDIETTGLDPNRGDRIVEIAGMRIENGEIVKEKTFDSMVNPGVAISPEASRINGIKQEDLIGAPPIEDVLPKFLDFASGTTLIAHNAGFDMSFLEAEKEMCWGYIDLPDYICTMKLSKSVFPNEYRHNLDVLSKRLGIQAEEMRHRALPDVLMTAQAFVKMIEIGKISSMEELKRRAGSVKIGV
ncbi:3'-5' exonuclease [Candidatus Peribacteria bacterium]|jgi:DNA polymerase III subunit epsilon|nr:3'-5' exonuclease [Candidatus Peribacteria bacterium]MBT4020996.1 3'-5' exonuclease [Candidatus Peribacteria bacterium]MBT4240895.1 3'-5' exonuclease [Candidatus Peribacteria bacterium]MBT4474118.1 3'-5' exonuclease [Candidatus Peribacteria bacterium]